MTARLLDGTAVAREIQQEVSRQVALLTTGGVRPGLAVILVGDDPASAVYVARKTRICEELGIHHETARLPASSSTAEVEALVAAFNERADIHGILVQTPLPRCVDAQRVLTLVDPRKDVDGFHPVNAGLLVQKRPHFVPCTPGGIMELLARSGIAVSGRRAVVVGRSDIVGKPMALLLLHGDATVTVAHSRTPDLVAVTRQADVLVAAIGRPGIITEDHVAEGAVVIDVGMNHIVDPVQAARLLEPARLERFRVNGRALVGDVCFPEVARKASAITPVPGGVGPLTIAMLMRNTVKAAGGA
jgi:methylenetetrahydrofolate dehydrogenase (NADP+) / methenyltetrahydrofolate cyclohydrolase